jgi:hypothetical protein
VLDPATNRWSIRPRKVKPTWTTAPLLYGLSKCLPGMFYTLQTPGTALGGLGGRSAEARRLSGSHSVAKGG